MTEAPSICSAHPERVEGCPLCYPRRYEGKIGTRAEWPYDRRDWLWLARLCQRALRWWRSLA